MDATASILISGGLGFVGSTLGLALADQGLASTLVDSLNPSYGGNMRNLASRINDPSLRINISDVRDHHSLHVLLRDAKVLFNLAGQTSHMDSMADPFTDLDINARAQLSLLEVCRQVAPGVRIVFASTRQIYGRPHYLPVDEAHPLQPVDVNGINKLAGEQYHLLYSQVYGISSTVLRLTNTYGPRMRIRDARQTFWASGSVTSCKDRLLKFGVESSCATTPTSMTASALFNLQPPMMLLLVKFTIWVVAASR